MCPMVNQTFSLTFDTYAMLEGLHKETQISRSKLIRTFITHFSKDRFALNKLIKEENLGKKPNRNNKKGGKS